MNLLELKIIIYVTNLNNIYKKKNGLNYHYEVLLIAYLKLTKKNAKQAEKKKLNQIVNLLDLKIIN